MQAEEERHARNQKVITEDIAWFKRENKEAIEKQKEKMKNLKEDNDRRMAEINGTMAGRTVIPAAAKAWEKVIATSQEEAIKEHFSKDARFTGSGISGEQEAAITASVQEFMASKLEEMKQDMG